MDLARATPTVMDLKGDLLAAYPALARRLALVLRDARSVTPVVTGMRGHHHGDW